MSRIQSRITQLWMSGKIKKKKKNLSKEIEDKQELKWKFRTEKYNNGNLKIAGLAQ